ncbi:hypothetical protein [Variovorax paradoxus]|uniref:Uncharacterized protein n=1 Tax=Variovorax paradoxus TaxID=34073 RepID=A0A679JBC5_VARPD|nr:hypothetical protein VVAX_03528 [Variovorax paradoxus]
MRSLSAAALTALSSSPLRIAQLVYMGFPGVPVALASSNFDIVHAGVTYRGAAGLGSISPIEDAKGEVKGLQFQMSGVPIEYLALALADATVVQGAAISIRNAILDAGRSVIEAPVDWTGYVDTMAIEEDGETCTVAVTAESSEVDLLRGNVLTTSDADQKFLYPGDRAFEFVIPQEGVPIVWPTKQYYIASR